ncbi:MAG: hypothetical protein ACREIA_01770 [Opitutaceae bacterium]
MFSRGCYTRTVLAAWDYRDRKLVPRWIFNTAAGGRGFMYYEHQGSHSLTAAGVDRGGRDEIVFGAAVIDVGGMGLYSTHTSYFLGHGMAPLQQPNIAVVRKRQIASILSRVLVLSSRRSFRVLDRNPSDQLCPRRHQHRGVVT